MKILLTLLLATSSIFAQTPKKPPLGLSLGVGMADYTHMFKASESSTIPIPFVAWTTEHFYLRGLHFGYHLYSKYPLVNITLQPVMLEVDNEEGSYNEALSKRYRTINMGIETTLPTPWFSLALHLHHDILNVYRGSMGSFEIKKRFHLLENFSLGTSMNFQYLSKQYNDYYYGIDHHEVRSDRSYYAPTYEFAWGPSLTMNYQLSNGMNLMFLTKYTRYGSEIGRSPLLKRDDQFQFFVSVTKNIN